MLNPTIEDGTADQSTQKCSHQRLDAAAFRAREVAALAMGWGWSQVGRENVPGGVQLLKDPPGDGQVLLSLREKERKSFHRGKEQRARTIPSAGAQHQGGLILPLFIPTLRRHRGCKALSTTAATWSKNQEPLTVPERGRAQSQIWLKHSQRALAGTALAVSAAASALGQCTSHGFVQNKHLGSIQTHLHRGAP